MDTFIITSIVVIIIVAIIVFICYILAPQRITWLFSNHEEKLKLSKNRIFNANGYLMHSESSIFLTSTGSFKRFESVDREYNPQESQKTSTTPPWNVSNKEVDIPPQPLRPAPKPDASIVILTNQEQSFVDSKSHSASFQKSSVIPRPIPRKQLSAPAANTNNNSTINTLEGNKTFSEVNTPKSSTNPFISDLKMCRSEQSGISNNNPFWNETVNVPIFNFEPTNIKAIFEECDLLKQAEERINILEASTSGINKKNRVKRNYAFDEKEKVTEDIVKEIMGTGRLNGMATSCERIDKCASLNNMKSTEVFLSLSDEKTLDGASTCLASKLRQQFKNRSLSETEASIMPQWLNDKIAQTSSVAKSKVILKKTVSETFLGQISFNRGIYDSNPNIFYNNKSIFRQASESSIDSVSSLPSTGNTTKLVLKRVASCESVSSQSSVLLEDLEQKVPSITGYLCIGLQYDKLNSTEDGVDLFVTILEAKDLVGPPDSDSMDTFIRIYLVPDESGAMQTRLFKNSVCPSYQETFSFWIKRNHIKRSLWFHLYHTNSRLHTLIGETEMKLDHDLNRPVTTWLTLSDSKHNNNNWGDLMFSLSYLPTAERLTVVVVKARRLHLTPPSANEGEKSDESIENVFVKIYLLKNDKKVSKKKTTIKKDGKSPIFNEAMIFSVPPYILNSLQVRLTVISSSSSNKNRGSSDVKSVEAHKAVPIGHVIVGSGTNGNGLRHWHQMLTSLRKPVAMWHELRQTISTKKN